HLGTGLEVLRELVEVDDLVDDAAAGVTQSAPFGEAHVDGGLPTLETRGHLATRLGSLGSAPGGRAALTGVASTHADLRLLRAGCWAEVVQLQLPYAAWVCFRHVQSTSPPV